ncbi:MAG: DUF359 domain-containing protein [Methanobacteriota archaeon]
MRVVSEDLKETLKTHIGRLVDEPGLLRILKKEKTVVSVGDRVTFTLLRHGFPPVMCVVDYILERRSYPVEMKRTIQSFGNRVLKVMNPAGCITDELWGAIESGYQLVHEGQGPVCIEVQGEEDLASLVAIYLAPPGVTVIYGLPNKGVVVVKTTAYHKKKVKDVLDKMM